MPQVLALALPASLGSTISVFGVSLTTAAGGLTLAGSVLSLAGNLLLSTALNSLLAPDIPTIRPDNLQINSKNATAPRVRHYGLVKTGGNVVFHRAKDGTSYRLLVHGHGAVDEVQNYYLNNEAVTIDGSGFVTDDQYQYGGRSRVQILSRLGAVPSPHYSEITAIWPEWTTAHRCDGMWTSLIITESVPPEAHREMFPNEEPALFALAETTKLHDPRTDTTVWSENLALAIADYISSPDGFNRADVLDTANIIEQANLADEAVTLDAGGTEARYRISGSYGLNEAPQDVLNKMLLAGAGQVRLRPNGKAHIELAQAKASNFTMEYKHLIEVQTVDAGPDGLDRYNVLPGRFVNHDLDHVEVDAEAWRDEARITRHGGELLSQSAYEALMSPSHRQTRAAMKVKMERDNPDQRLSLVCKPSALPAIYEDVVTLDVPQLGLSGKYEVTGNRLTFDKGLIASVFLSLSRINDDAFSLALDEQGAVQEMPPADTPTGVPLPTNVTAVGAGVQAAANVFVAGIAVAWTADSSDALRPFVRVSPANTGYWTDVPVGSGLTNVGITGLTDGSVYDVSVAFITPGGVTGDAVIIEDVTASAASDPPAAPTGLSVTDNGDSTATVSMTSSTSADLWQTEVYRDAVLIATFYVGAVGPDTVFEFIDDCGAGTFDWTARSVNVSNVDSTSDAGPETETIA